jgi:hypothetical protein
VVQPVQHALVYFVRLLANQQRRKQADGESLQQHQPCQHLPPN